MNRPTLAHTALAFLIAGVLAAPAPAATSRSWTLRERKDFSEAQFDGVSLAEDGSLRLAAGITSSFEVPQPNLWCVAADSKGRVYVGGGNDGRVYRIGPAGGEIVPVFDADQIGVHALAVDSQDRIYAASSPDGAIWRIEEGRDPVILHDPGAKFIWSLVLDAQDRIYAALGSPGRVVRLDTRTPDAAPLTVLETGEDHIRSLARAQDGSIYAGSDGGGIIYRIDPEGRSRVVYDTPMREIAAIAVDASEGAPRIWAAALGPVAAPRGRPSPESGSQGSGDGVTRVRVTAEGDEGEEESQPSQPQQQEQRRPPVQERYQGAIYRIDADGYARQVWESRQQLPLSIAVLRPSPGRPQGVLVGTADQGDVILLGSTAEASAFVTVPSQQVNALAALDDGTVLAAASNLGRVVRIRPGGQESGELTSTVHDAGFTSTWGSISWTADVPRGASVRFQVRTGDTEQPDGTWSAWSADLSAEDGTPIPSPRARFIQWRARLRAASTGESPVIRSVSLGYLQDNMPPEITSVEIQPPGLVLIGMPPQADSNGAPARRQRVQPRRTFEKGKRSVTWSAQDSNDDDLRYDVEFKAEDEKLWKPLAKDLSTEFHSWDETSMPDGVYRIRVRATDSPSNPPGAEKIALRLSAAFDVDTTPPVVGSPRFRPGARSRGAGAGEVEVTVSDTFSPIGDVAWSLDAGPWVPVHPVDGIADSKEESFRFTVDGLAPGEHTVTVRATDRAGNTGASRVVLRIE